LPTAGSTLGSKRSDAVRKKIAIASAANWLNPEFKERMKQCTTEQMKHKRKPFLCLQNNTVYESTRSAAQSLGLDCSSVTKVLRGKMLQT
ncbi:hypothetical protein ABNJ30_20000, partial [Acinetobacter baumannii]